MAKLVDEFERSLEDKFAEAKLQESCVKCNCIVSENMQVLPHYPKVELSCETFCKPKWHKVKEPLGHVLLTEAQNKWR